MKNDKNENNKNEDDLLNEILGIEGEEEKDEAIALPKKILIGTGAMDKAFTVCRLLKEVRGSSSEWYGLMIGTLDKPEVIRDFVFGKQESSAAHTEIDGSEVGKLTDLVVKERGKDWIVNGWIHSHGGLATFFSGTDDTNMETVLNSVYINTRKSFKKAYNFIEGKKNLSYNKDKKEVLMTGILPTDPEITLGLPSSRGLDKITQEQLKKIVQIKIKQPVLAGWSYSIVVNDKNDKKGHINYKEELPLKHENKTWDESADIVVINEPVYEIKIDENTLKKEIEEKIKAPAPVMVYSNYKNWQNWAHKPWISPSDLYAKGYERIFSKKELSEKIFKKTEIDDDEKIKEPDEESIAEFLQEMCEFYRSAGPTQFPTYEKRQTYHSIVDAILGGINAHPSFSGWLEDRLLKEDKDLKGNYEGALYKLMIDPAVVGSILEYCKTNQDFAKLVVKFRKNHFKRKMALEEYEDSQMSQYEKEESEAKEEKTDNKSIWGAIDGLMD